MKKELSTSQLKESLQKQLNEISEKEHKELQEIQLPIFQKRYNGSETEKWPLYVFFEKITDVYDTKGNGISAYATGFKFQTDCHGSVVIEKETNMYVHLYTTKCTKREFMAAHNKMLKAITKMVQ